MSRFTFACPALLACVLGLPADEPAKEPTHDGKPLSEWVKQLGSKDADARDKAAASLRALAGRSDAVAEALLAALNPPESASPAQVRLLIELGPRAVPALTAALYSPDEQTRRVALMILPQIGEDARPAIPSVARLLADPNPDRRRHAVDALRDMGAESAVPTITKLLADPDEDIGVRAADALGALGADPAPMIPVLIQLLESKQGFNNGLVFRRAMRLLGGLGPEAAPAVPALVARLGKASPGEADGLALTLGKIGPAAKDAVPALKGLLKDPKDDTGTLRHEVAVALWRIARDPAAVTLLRDSLATWTPTGPPTPEVLWRIDQSPETVAALEKLLKSENPEMAITAAGLLGTKSKEAVPLLGRILSHKDANVRGRAVVALAHLGPQAKDARESLRAARKDDVPYIAFYASVAACRLNPEADSVAAVAGFLEDPDVEIRRNAAEVLGQLYGKGSPAAPRLTTARSNPDPQTRLLAAKAWWNQTSNPAALAAMAESLKDPNPEVREMAALHIGAGVGAEAKAAVPELVKRLFDPFSRVRSTAAEALGRIGPAARDAVPALLAVLEGDEPGFVQSAACEALGLIDPADKEAAAAVLKAKLGHPDPLTRTHAALALFRVNGDTSGEKVAERGLGYRRHEVRITAAEALWRMKKDDRVVPLLVRALEESNLDGRGSDNERYMAARALGRIGPAAKPAVSELAKLVHHHDYMLATTATESLRAIDPEAAKKAGVE